MEAGAHFAEVETTLRRDLDAEQVRLVEVLRDRSASPESKDEAYAALVAQAPRSLGALVVAFVQVLEVVARRRGPEDVLSEFCELVVAGVGRREIKGMLLNALRRRKQPMRPEPTIEPDFAAILDVSAAIERGIISEDEHDLLQAYWVYGRTAPEIAAEAGISAEAAWKRIERARKKMRRWI